MDECTLLLVSVFKAAEVLISMSHFSIVETFFLSSVCFLCAISFVCNTEESRGIP
jgi:hypothetical protein